MKIKTLIKSLIISCLFFVASGVVASQAMAAPRLYFDPASVNAAKGADTSINLLIDVENKSAFGADATITFPSNDFTVKSVTNGGFFSDFSFAQSSGQLEIHGYFSALYNSKSGNGTFAVITLNSNKDTGTGTMNFTCSQNSSSTEILDSNGQNILSCSSLNQENLTYTSPNVSSNGPTNACGGTCGSIYNCDTGLFCYNGFCRNPDCRDSSSCGCTATATPKPTVKPTPKPSIKPTPQVVTLAKFTPLPSSTPEESPTSEPVGSPNAKFDYVRVGIWTALSLLAFLLLLGILRLFKGKDTPEDNPPTVIPPTDTPTVTVNEPAQPTQSEPIQTYPITPPAESQQPNNTIQNPPETPTSTF